MSKLSWWKRTLMATGLVIAAVAALAVRPREGRSAEPPEPVQAQAFKYFGSGECQRCHAYTEEEAIRFSRNSVGFIKLNEYKTWKDEDKHSLAFARLLSDRGRRIAGLLKVDVTKSEGGCLGCHSASVSEVQNRAKPGDLFDKNEGVSCENCHGPYSAWAAPHTQVEFRNQSQADWAKVGFNDLRSPEIQSEKCLSCHVGNFDEGKVVTHEMYAAGHPPLPSIEVATFTNSIPRHWWLLAERKDSNLRKALGFKEGELEQTKLALVGAAVAFRTSMKLLADESKPGAKDSAPGQGWPDFARYDCWSCHHDLKRESWRQARGYAGPPGRVPVSEWPMPVVELGITRISFDDPAGAAALGADLQRLQKELHDQAINRAFGRQDALVMTANNLANWSVVLTKKLMASSYDRATGLRLLKNLVEETHKNLVNKSRKASPDYDAARHIAWTIKLLVEDLGDQLPKSKADAIRPILAKFDGSLKLVLPAGRKYEIEDNIGSALESIGDYEPAQFQSAIEQLAEILNAN